MRLLTLTTVLLLSGCSNWYMIGPTEGEPTGDSKLITIYITGDKPVTR